MNLGFPAVVTRSYDVLCQIRDRITEVAKSEHTSKHNATVKGTASNDYGRDTTLPFPATKLDVILYDNGAIFKRGPEPNAQYDDEIELIAPGHYSFAVQTGVVNIKNAVSGSNARYSFIAWD